MIVFLMCVFKCVFCEPIWWLLYVTGLFPAYILFNGTHGFSLGFSLGFFLVFFNFFIFLFKSNLLFLIYFYFSPNSLGTKKAAQFVWRLRHKKQQHALSSDSISMHHHACDDA